MFGRRLLPSIALLFLLVSSCSKDYSHEGGLSRKCLGCSYLPVCDSSVFVYVDSSAAGIDTIHNAVRILADTTIDGTQYRQVSGLASFTGLLTNCDNEQYKLVVNLSALGINLDSIAQVLLQQINLPIPLPPLNIPSTLKTTVLKANSPVNTAWTDTIFNYGLPPLFSLSMGLDYKMTEVNVSRTVFQKTYTNVIHVNSTLNITSTLGNIPLDYELDFFFAKGVGIIELQIRSNNVLQQSERLYSYVL
jgi:hypothetical protein